jgi:hypothetical protein
MMACGVAVASGVRTSIHRAWLTGTPYGGSGGAICTGGDNTTSSSRAPSSGGNSAREGSGIFFGGQQPGHADHQRLPAAEHPQRGILHGRLPRHRIFFHSSGLPVMIDSTIS